jgi:hypothetical protein
VTLGPPTLDLYTRPRHSWNPFRQVSPPGMGSLRSQRARILRPHHQPRSVFTRGSPVWASAAIRGVEGNAPRIRIRTCTSPRSSTVTVNQLSDSVQVKGNTLDYDRDKQATPPTPRSYGAAQQSCKQVSKAHTLDYDRDKQATPNTESKQVSKATTMSTNRRQPACLVVALGQHSNTRGR